MQILECTLTEFGSFREKTFTFSDGLNLIEGDNESGKSTLLAFIQFMFYGVPRKSAGEIVPERDRILSWNGGVASGRMTVETADGTFRIERTLRRVTSGTRDTYPETVKLIDLATGEPIHPGEEPGEVFFGVPAQVYESTCAVRQAQCTHLYTTELGSSLENLLFTGDESLNTQRAITRIDGIRRTLLHKNGKGGRLYELNTERKTLRERLERARMSAAAMVDRQNRIEELEKQSVVQRDRLSASEEKCNNFENLALLRRFTQVHDLEEKTGRLRARLEELHHTRAHNGYLPDDAYLANLRSLKQRLRIALEDCDQTRLSRDRAQRESALDDSRRKCLAHADQVRAAGGVEPTVNRFLAHTTAVSHLLLPALLMTILGVLFIALGAVTCFLPTLPSFLPVLLFSAGGVFGVTGMLCFILRARRRAALTAFLTGYDLSPTCTKQAPTGYLQECVTFSHRYAQAQDALQNANRLLTERERVLHIVCKDCVQTLARMGIAAEENTPEILPDLLDHALTDFSALAVEHEKLRREWERLEANLTDLRAELAGQNEAELRAHLSVEQAESVLGEDITKLRSERDYLRRAVSDANARRTEMEKQLVSLEATAENPAHLALRLEELEETLADCQLRHDALMMAAEAVALASERVRRGVTPRLRSAAAAWMNRLTDGRYTDLGVSGSMSVTVDVNGETRPIEAMSGGTVDAAYLSLRLALLELLYGLDRPPLLLDESLYQLDDRRATQFLSMLTGWCRAGGQCLLFTCQSREAAIARNVSAFTHVRLSPPA